MAKTKIEWTEKTWNPVTGCTKVSQGCKNCYAEVLAKRFWKDRKFTDVQCHPDRLEQPLHWRKPAKVFVNSMSDLFHESVPFEFIDKLFAIMHKAEKHTFQILTKRPERALQYILMAMHDEDCNYGGFYDQLDKYGIPDATPMPNNIWIGTSVEDQKTADERIPLLLQIPAAVRFLSCEPLLGEVKLKYIEKVGVEEICTDYFNGLKYRADYDYSEADDWGKLHWVVCGGESGHGARPMHPDWARKLRDDCQAAGVPFFFKQWGEWIDVEQMPKELFASVDKQHNLAGNSQKLWKLGKKYTGRFLDGVEHNGMPEVK